ncbi:MAG TPA: hypothetical protein PKK23_17630 [Nitrospirales bacterium]|nr:hypothetical protein [Nitrospiraceae bacterium]HNP30869.1 hypothetical protein [Nitrospirales bacterium]
MSLAPERRLVLFIHGFRGTALGTWDRFPVLVEGQKKFQGCDLVFYGYSSKWQRTQVLANDFRDALDLLFSQPRILLQATATESNRASDFRFEEVFLVAHSMGALVARQALLDAFQMRYPWTSKVRLALFAPAHMGADLLRLCMQTLAPFPIPVSLAAHSIYPCLHDLVPTSQTINLVISRAKNLDPLSAKTFSAHGVWIAAHDQVVSPNAFPGDPPSKTIRGRTHISMCKPTNVSSQAFKGLETCIP